MRRMTCCVMAVCVILIGAGVVRAQQPPRLLQPYTAFNFYPPGARPLAMGASFIGLADDATAAEANPAGLTILIRPEISGHFRYARYTYAFPDPAGIHPLTEFSDTRTAPSFASVVIPSGRFAVSLYYQQATNFLTHAEYSGDFTDDGLIWRYQFENRFDYLLTNVGVAGAVRIVKELSIGVAIRWSRVRLNRLARIRLQLRDLPPEILSGELQDEVDDTDNGLTVNAGILINPAGRVSLGFVYKSGVTFEVTNVATDRFTFFGETETRTVQRTLELKVPQVFGGGIAVRPLDTLTLTADVVFITYSDLSLPPRPEEGFEGRTIDDAVEFHGGLEYILFAGETPISLRAGFYTDPDHDVFERIDTGQVHFTFGGGIVIQNTVQIDVAIDIAKTVKQGLTSVVIRF